MESLASAALVGALYLCALPCAGKGEADASPQSLYAGRTQDADVLIDIPNLRQYGGYTCGTTCVQMLMNWLEPYQADLNLTAYEEALEQPRKPERLRTRSSPFLRKTMCGSSRGKSKRRMT